ncbi:enoyl-CoA hydratase-related protein [Sphingomonas immobilis]|uniref:Enoyl-CoA hydratase-related protein n=1 Tax=Sphingomonas immobilis TaxID=3063997 RepID=A0ABT8ZX92_9SPHN|nr:enoyl-CoA hydratase-related protein [Sphingomonas sp. CA1-15]MDO7842158.1 enoyl-CoA hydratase-related protein [Sphingomonas sp. CA1-15]
MTTETPAAVGKEVLFEIVDDHVAIVTLNRPEKRNAVNAELARGVQWIVKQVEADDAIRVAIITSSLESTFCAGADLAEIAAGRGALIAPDGDGFAGFNDAKRDKPWIAAVRGACLAGGFELALACDMIVAADDARFGLPETKRGLFAGGGGTFRLPRAIPRNVALEMLATGDPISAERAYALGLVNRLVPSAGVLGAARDLAGAIASAAPVSVRETLKVARLVSDRSEAELRALGDAASKTTSATEDAREGPRAFLEKRAPVWAGR